MESTKVNSRPDRQVDQSLQVLLESMENDIRELRTRQSIPRNLTTKTYITQIPGTWDITSYAVPANGTASKIWTWISDGKTPAPLVQFYALVTNNASTLNNYGYSNPSTTGGYSLTNPTFTVGDINNLGQNTFARQINFYSATLTAGSFNVKMIVVATGKGSLSITT
jgi:hypothetical protein